MAKLDNRKRVIGLKSKRVFTSIPSGGTQYAERIDGAIFVRKHIPLTGSGFEGRVGFSAWKRLDNARLAEHLRNVKDGPIQITINGVDFDKRLTNRLRLPQDVGV